MGLFGSEQVKDVQIAQNIVSDLPINFAGMKH